MGGLAASTQSRPSSGSSAASMPAFKTRLAPSEKPIRAIGEPSIRGVQPPDHLAQIFAAARVIDPASQPESVARAAQVHPHDPDAQAQQPPADPHHVVRLGTTRQSVHQHRGGHRRSQPDGHRFENEQPVAVGQRNLVRRRAASCWRSPPMYRPTIVWACAPLTSGCGSNGGTADFVTARLERDLGTL